MFSLFLRNVFFTILQPGIVAGVVPYWIAGNERMNLIQASWQSQQWLGFFLFMPGLVIMLECIRRFATEGRGTLSPADPTKKLVIKGLYKYSRNPMYIGVMLMLTGESVFFQSGPLWIYSLSIFCAFNLFIIFAEEPRLHKEFGEEYRHYTNRVRRWL